MIMRYTFREPGNGSDMAIRVDGYILHVHSIMLRTHSTLLDDLIPRGIFGGFLEPLEVARSPITGTKDSLGLEEGRN